MTNLVPKSGLLVAGLLAALPLAGLAQPADPGPSNLPSSSMGTQPVQGQPAPKRPLEQFKETLEAFLKAASLDPVLTTLLSKNPVTIEYIIPDMDLHCHIGPCAGKLVGAIGEPNRKPELTLVTPASTLDRILRGEEVKADIKVITRLDLYHKILLKNDFNRIRSALVRVYRSTCEQTSFGGLDTVRSQPIQSGPQAMNLSAL